MEILQNAAKKARDWFVALPTLERLATVALSAVVGVAVASVLF